MNFIPPPDTASWLLIPTLSLRIATQGRVQRKVPSPWHAYQGQCLKHDQQDCAVSIQLSCHQIRASYFYPCPLRKTTTYSMAYKLATDTLECCVRMVDRHLPHVLCFSVIVGVGSITPPLGRHGTASVRRQFRSACDCLAACCGTRRQMSWSG